MSRHVLGVLAIGLTVGLGAAACHSDPAQPATATGGAGVSGGAGSSGGAAGSVGVVRAALHYDGAVVMREHLEISAPILPNVLKLYTTFPATLEGEQAMAHDAALTFDWLLVNCAPMYPQITLASNGVTTLTPEQLATNYEQVGRCSYEKYTAKPYWIPKLIDDVDICGTELGADWRLITEADLAGLTESDFQTFQATLTPSSAGSGDFFGSFYFGLGIWLRAADGTIKAGTLAPGAGSMRVTPLATSSATDHYEGALALRCILR